MSGVPAIDMSALEPFRDDADFLGLLIDEFVAEAPRRIVTLRRAGADGDLKALRSEAHALKGSARVFGAAPLAAMCETLEAAQAVDATTRACLDGLDDEFHRVRSALQRERASAASEGGS